MTITIRYQDINLQKLRQCHLDASINKQKNGIKLMTHMDIYDKGDIP